MRKLSLEDQKKIYGGKAIEAIADCRVNCPPESSTYDVSCPSGTKKCSTQGQCVNCDGEFKCCRR